MNYRRSILINKTLYPSVILLLMVLFGCGKSDNSVTTDTDSNSNTNIVVDTCTTDQVFNNSRGACTETLTFTQKYTQRIAGNKRIIESNAIPNHKTGKFGGGQGSLNPNAISPQTKTYEILVNGVVSTSLTPLLKSTGSGRNGPQYIFGILLNGIELDPVAAEPFPHKGIMDPNVNWEWNLEALNVNLGLDCNSAHVQPSGKYHYHGPPTLYLDGLNISKDKMTLIGYAADGFPIYYNYAYSVADDTTSSIVKMVPKYQLKTGKRGGNGTTAPCDVYNGIYTNDYEYINDLASGTLDEANGRNGVTPEYPNGTYYYVMTDDFPSIPRHFKGTPSDSFRIGNN